MECFGAEPRELCGLDGLKFISILSALWTSSLTLPTSPPMDLQPRIHLQLNHLRLRFYRWQRAGPAVQRRRPGRRRWRCRWAAASGRMTWLTAICDSRSEIVRHKILRMQGISGSSKCPLFPFALNSSHVEHTSPFPPSLPPSHHFISLPYFHISIPIVFKVRSDLCLLFQGKIGKGKAELIWINGNSITVMESIQS